MIAAATILFARSGFNGVTTKEIAKRANVSDGNIFRYFPTKRDLFIAVIDSELGKLSLRAEQFDRIENVEDSQIELTALFELITEAMLHQPGLVRLLQFSILDYGPDIEPTFRRHLRPIVDLATRNLQGWSCGSNIWDLHPALGVLSFIATIATVIMLQDVFPEFYGSPGSIESVESGTAAAAKLWLRALSPETNGRSAH